MDKQIENMYKDVYEAIAHNSVIDVTHGGYIGVNTEGLTKELYDDGYRKATDVVEEVIKSVDEMFDRQKYSSRWVDENMEMLGYADIGYAYECWRDYIKDELKRKYIGEDTNVLTKESEGEG